MSFLPSTRWSTWVGAVLLLSACLGEGMVTRARQAQEPQPAQRGTAPLPMKMPGSFSIASVGDMIIRRPASMRHEPAFQRVVQIVKDADVGFGNFEGSISDLRTFDGPLAGFMGTKEVAADIKKMNFTMVARATNHLFDSDEAGMFATDALLDQAGVVHAGSGSDLENARAPQFLETSKGRVGLVALHAPHDTSGHLLATERIGNAGGRPGLNGLRFTIYFHVTQEQLDALRKVRDAMLAAPPGVANVSPPPSNEPKDRLQMFGTSYKVGTPGTGSYEMNPDDLRGVLRSVRDGKQYADFMIMSAHVHQAPLVSQEWLFEDQTPDFLIDLAHQAIDNGADVFVGHGPHVIRGVEIYKGKPIFYDLGEFFREYTYDPTLVTGSWSTAMAREDFTDAGRGGGVREINYESLLALSKYDQGRLVEVRFYPIDGHAEAPMSQIGYPRLANHEVAQRILTRLQTLSKPFGTTIAMDGDVGVIKIAATASPGPAPATRDRAR